MNNVIKIGLVFLLTTLFVSEAFAQRTMRGRGDDVCNRRGGCEQRIMTQAEKVAAEEKAAKESAEREVRNEKRRQNNAIKSEIRNQIMPYIVHFKGMVQPDFTRQEEYTEMPNIPEHFTQEPYLSDHQQIVLEKLLSYRVKEATEAVRQSPKRCDTTTSTVGLFIPIQVGKSTSCGKDLAIGRSRVAMNNPAKIPAKEKFYEACKSELRVSLCSCVVNGVDMNPYAQFEPNNTSMKIPGIDGKISQTEYNLFLESPTAFARYIGLQLPATSILGRANAILNSGAHTSAFERSNPSQDELARKTALIIGSSVGDHFAMCHSLVQ